MRRKNRKNFGDHINTRINTTDDDKKKLDIDKIGIQKCDVELSNEIVVEQKIVDSVDAPRRKELDIDKRRAQKGDIEFSNEIVEERKTIDIPHMGLLSWIGGTVLLLWALGLIFSIGGLMIHWLLLIAAVVLFIVDMISGKSRREI